MQRRTIPWRAAGTVAGRFGGLFLLLACLASPAAAAGAEGEIGVLEFELRDMTLAPRTPAEVARTRSIAPLLLEALRDGHGLAAVAVDPRLQADADAAVGYLYDHIPAAVALGRRIGVEWIAVGRVHKPSFLFVYLMLRLVHVPSASLARDFVVEVKGSDPALNTRGATRLAEQIAATIAAARVDAHPQPAPGRQPPPRGMDRNGRPPSTALLAGAPAY